MSKIYDCLMYNGEDKMLNFRLHQLSEKIEKFLIVEGESTFSGHPKKLRFDINKFAKFKDRIIYKSVPGLTDQEAWNNEYTQRRYIKECFRDIELKSDDIILLSDVDEIPDFNKIDRIPDIAVFYQDFYYYNTKCRNKNKWRGTIVINAKLLLDKFNFDFENLRQARHQLPIIEGGWHYSYFGDADYIIDKIKSFSHQEYNEEKYTNPDSIKKLIETGSDLFFRHHEVFEIVDSEYVPEFLHILSGKTTE